MLHGHSQRWVAKVLGVSQATVSHVVSGRTWSELGSVFGVPA